MDYLDFSRLLRTRLPEGTEMENPGGGITTILRVDEARLNYRRGRSRFSVGLKELHEAYERFSGCEVSTTELKAHAPGVFDSGQGGHNCHCTVLFMALQRMGLAGGTWGCGRAGAPFGATFA